MKKLFPGLHSIWEFVPLELKVGIMILISVLCLYVFASLASGSRPQQDEQCLLRGQTWSCQYQTVSGTPEKVCYCHD